MVAPQTNTHREMNIEATSATKDDTLALPDSDSSQLTIQKLLQGGSESRHATVEQISQQSPQQRSALAVQIRSAIISQFAENKSGVFIRAWLFSGLIAAEPELPASRQLIEQHLSPSFEPALHVRFWILAALFKSKVSYLTELARGLSSSGSDEVAELAQAILTPQQPQLLQRFEKTLRSGDATTILPVLRIARVVALPALLEPMCALLPQGKGKQAYAYYVFHAVCHDSTRLAAHALFAQQPGHAEVVRLFMETFAKDETGRLREFAGLLMLAGKPALLQQLLDYARQEKYAVLAQKLIRLIEQSQLVLAGYQSDAVPPWNLIKDKLGIDKEVATFAANILSRNVNPPLAIGLFGDWGSGKSFFMRAMMQKIEQEKTRPAFYNQVVQIEFNAWHYSDSNLLASMVNHILEQLFKHVYHVEDTSKAKMAELICELDEKKAEIRHARDEWDQAKSQLDAAEKALQEQQNKLQQLTALKLVDVMELIELPERQKSMLKKLWHDMGWPESINSVLELKDAISQAKQSAGRVSVLVTALSRKVNWAALLLLVILVPPLFEKLLQFFNANSLSELKVALATLGCISASIAHSITSANEFVKAKLSMLEQAQQKIEATFSKKQQNLSEDDKFKLTQAQQAEQKAAAEYQQLLQQTLAMEARYQAIREEHSLGRFLTTRTESGDYQKQLGLVSMVRRDFETLEDRLANRGDQQEKVERIVLYIDDLDRCPADKVVEVLQAVHLLLAFKLFVVVVGVDSRWVLQSLEKHYRELGTEIGNATAANQRAANARQYLDKIFQVQYALRRMSEPGFGALIQHMIQGSNPPDDNDLPPLPADSLAQPLPAPVALNPAATGEQPGMSTTAIATAATTTTGQANNMPAPVVDGPAMQAAVPETVPEQVLLLQSWEGEFAQKLHFLIPTPRATKRLINSYRILKAGLSMIELEAFQGRAQQPGEFQLPLLLLALLIHDPILCSRWFCQWLQQARLDTNQSIQTLLADSQAGAPDRLLEQLRGIVNEPAFPASASLLLQWIPLVARFSFDCAQAIDQDG